MMNWCDLITIELIAVAMKLYANLTEINAKIGQRITLSCFAEGNPKPKIIWHKIGRSKNELNWIELN